MRNKKLIKLFESFTKDNLDYLIKYKNIYVKPINKIIKSNTIFNKIKNYNISNFNIVEKNYGIFIYPDKEFIELCKKVDDTVDENLLFYITINGEFNQIDFTEGIPEQLRGLSIGYKIYKLIIDKFLWITSNKFSSISAYNLWYNLLQDEDLYCFTSSHTSGLISKKINDEELLKIINKIKMNFIDIEYDDELINKINKISSK